MKKLAIFTTVVAMSAILSCKQEPTMPSEAEIAQKVQDLHGAEFQNLTDLKKLECANTINEEVSKKLAEMHPVDSAK